jgi:predicted GIY-YIG superfamily endonuclease
MGARWCVYILRCGDGTLYTGATNDLDARVAAHRAGRGARYTRGRGPLVVVYCEPCEGRSEALSLEVRVKRLSRGAKAAACAVGLDQRPISEASSRVSRASSARTATLRSWE